MTILIGAVLVVIFALLLFVFQVRQSEVAVVTTFGKPGHAPSPNPDAYFKWPWPIQKVYKFDQRIQNFEDKFSESLTADNNILLTSVYVGWRISDAAAFLPTFPGDPSVSLPTAQAKLEGMLRSAKSAVIGKHPLSDFVNADPQELKFDAIENEIEQSVQIQLRTNNYGIRIEFLGIKKIGLPESVTQTVFDRMKSERQVLISRARKRRPKRRRRTSSPPPTARPPTPSPTRRPPPRASGPRARPRPPKRCPSSSRIPNWRFSFCASTRWQQSLNQHSTLIFDERTPPFDLFRNLPTNAPGRPAMSDEHDHHHPPGHPAPAPMPPEDAGSQALAEALRSSFAIVKIVMVRHGGGLFQFRLFHRRPAGKGGHSALRQTGRRGPEGLARRGFALVVSLSD